MFINLLYYNTLKIEDCVLEDDGTYLAIIPLPLFWHKQLDYNFTTVLCCLWVILVLSDNNDVYILIIINYVYTHFKYCTNVLCSSSIIDSKPVLARWLDHYWCVCDIHLDLEIVAQN